MIHVLPIVCVEDMLTTFREVEATTVALEEHGLGLTFPVPGMLTSSLDTSTDVR